MVHSVPVRPPSTFCEDSGALPVLEGALLALQMALDAKDSYTGKHSLRVRVYASAIARILGLGSAERREIELAAEFHDIGKIGIPDELLHRAGPLSQEEHRRVLQHTVIGERILAPLFQDHPTVLAVTRWHHERVDGAGFPDGLRCEEIPLSARIVAVADSFDAMTTSRPYRRALPLSWAMQQLRECAGSQFDHDCVHALLRMLRTRSRRVIPQRGRGAHPFLCNRCRIAQWDSLPATLLLAALTSGSRPHPARDSPFRVGARAAQRPACGQS